MERAKDSISVRIARLSQMLQNPYSHGGTVINSNLNVEALQDAMLVLYDECNSEEMKKFPDVAKFVEKFGNTVLELRALRVQPTDFEIQALIGRGNFGKVNLVKEKATGNYFAMKTLPKKCTQGQKEASSYEEERDILALAARPGATVWLPTLQYAFQDPTNLYLVMEYLPGGDLLALLDKFEGSLPESTAKFYIAELVLSINSLHQLGYVHRDVKPDNVLLDICGHIKLADFGSAAKLNASGKVESPMPVGTPEYIAPEVLQSVSGSQPKYGVEVDYWSLGIVAYELMYGITPFNGAERTRIYSSIMAHEGGESLEFPSCGSISRDLRALISGLLEPFASRLTYVHVKRHAFFTGISWDTLRDTVPPYVPVVYGEADTSNFPEPAEQENDGISVDNFRSKHRGFNGDQLPFVGFTLTPGSVPKSSVKSTKQQEKQTASTSSSNGSQHPDIVRSREIQVLKEILQEREQRLETATTLRKEAETKLDHMILKANNYRKVIETERTERREVETKAVEVVKSLKAKWQLASQQKIAEINAQLELAQSGWSKSKSRIAELEEKIRTREEQLNAERSNSDRLHSLLQQQKTNMTKARRETLTFMGDAGQITELKKKLAAEEALNQKLQDNNRSLIDELAECTQKVSDLRAEVERLEDNQDKAERELEAANTNLKKLEMKFGSEKKQHEKTKQKLEMANAELSQSIAELERSRDNSIREELEEKVRELQEHVNELEREKHQLSFELDQANSKDEEQQGKVAGLEQLLSRVEERIAKLEEENGKLQETNSAPATAKKVTSTCGETALLQAQLERLETQLEKAREASVLDRQACRTAQSDLYKKEKELADARIDIRIAQRELKGSETLVGMLKQEQEQLTKQAEENQAKVDTLTTQLQIVTSELETTKKQLTESQTRLQELRDHSNETEIKLKERCRQLQALEAELTKKSDVTSKLQQSLETVKSEAETAKTKSRDTSSELNQLKAQVESLQLNNNALREACTMLDEQLEDSDKVRSAYEMQIAQSKQERESLRGELERIKCELRAKIQETEELRALKKVAEEKVATAHRDATFQATEALEESKELSEQLKEARLQADQLLAQVNELESVLCESDRLTREQKHIIEAQQARTASLQEEIAKTLTDLQVARESAEALSSRLEMSKASERETEQRLNELECHTNEEKSVSDQRIQRLQATLAQQTKLIDFLQAQALAAKKKRTLADKLFGSRPKENVAPSTPLRPAGQMSAKDKSRTWDNGRTAARTPGKDLSKSTPMKPEVKKEVPQKSEAKVETKPVDPKPETKAVIPVSSGNAPLILDQRVLPEYCRLSINCAVQLSENVVLLGAEEGLYSLHPMASGFQLVHIAGATRIKHMVTAPHLGLALFICGSPPLLRQCELRSLIVAAEAAQCSKPSVTLKVVDHAPDQCNVFAVSGIITTRDQPNSFLCVANNSHVSVLRWNVGGSQFEPVRLLATSHPAASLLFTQHSLLIVCDDIFEIDLQDFSVDEFLDMSDSSLGSVRAALKSRDSKSSVTMIDVTRTSARAEPEFMLCLSDFAVFLDAFGHRSRPGDLKWPHKPLSFVYRSPSLFVQFNRGVLELKPNGDDLCKKCEESIPSDDSLLTLLEPKLLGGGVKPGCCIVSAQQGSGATALLTLGAIGADDISIASEDTGDDRFSFTSSLENSLEGDEISSEASNKKVQFA